MSLRSEISEQAPVVESLTRRNRRAFEALANLLSDEEVGHVVVAARGSSDNAARYAQHLWGTRNRLATYLATPSLFSRYAASPSLIGALVVGISQSGESPDLIAVLAEAGRQGRPTVAITNRPQSPLATRADIVIDLGAGEERSVAATKSYTAELAAIAAVSAFMREEPDEMAGIAGSIEQVLRSESAIDSAAAAISHANRCVVIGRGFHLATAHEWALKVQELAYILAQPYSTADFLHGPVAAIEPGLPVLVVATHGEMYQQTVELTESVRQTGAAIVALTDSHEFPAEVVIHVPEVQEWLSPIVAAPAIQLFAHSLALAGGGDPERPRGLSKITRTL